MSSERETLLLLANALRCKLLTSDRVCELVQELPTAPQASLYELLMAKRWLSAEELASLKKESLKGTKGCDGSAHTDDNPPPPVDSGAETEIAATGHFACPADIRLDGDDTLPAELDTQGFAIREPRPRYALRGEVARGGLGRVIRVRDRYVGRDVAIKQILPGRADAPDVEDRFVREARITGRLEHPGIVPIHDLGVGSDGQLFYSMKLLKGRTLGAALREYHKAAQDGASSSRIELNRLLDAFVDVCNAVAFAHSKNILHRDLKPGNVMLGQFGEAIVVDWGLAKVMGQADASDSLDADASARDLRDTAGGDTTEPGTLMGTPRYMSPEQASGEIESLDSRSEIFSLGAILYEILVGRHAFKKDHHLAVLARVQKADFPAPRSVNSTIPKALEAVCLKAMALDRDSRYTSALELAHEIQRWQSGEPVEAYPEPWTQRTSRWIRAHRTLCLSSLTAAIALVATAAAWNWYESARTGRLEASYQRAMQRGRDSYFNDDLSSAQTHFTQAGTILEAEAALATLSPEFQRWSDRVERDLNKLSAQTAAEVKLNTFRAHHENAHYYGFLETGADASANLARAEREARAGLELFDVDIDEPSAPRLDVSMYDDGAKDEICAGCRELIFILAELTAHKHRASQSDPEAFLEAVRTLDASLAFGPPLKSYYQKKSDYLAAAGDANSARQARDSASGVEATTAVDHFFLGSSAYRNQDYHGALKHFETSQQLDPAGFWTQYLVSVCQLRLGRLTAAVAGLTACANRRPEFIGSYLLRGWAYGELGDRDKAELDFASVVRFDEAGVHRYQLLLNRGFVALRHGDRERAHFDFQDAVVLRPESADAYINLAEALRTAGSIDQALEQLARAIENDPDDPRPYSSRARIRFARGDLDVSLNDFQQAIDREIPGSIGLARAYAEFGRIMHRKNQYAEAVDAYDKALSIRPDFADARYLRALVLVDMNRDPEALEDFNTFLEESNLVVESHASDAVLSPRLAAIGTVDDDTLLAPGRRYAPKRLLASFYRERGLARLKTGDEDGAMQDFAHAVELVPQTDQTPNEYDRNRFALMHSRRGWAYLLNAKRLALAEFNSAIDIGPENGEPYTGRGYSLALLGKHKQAVADAEQAIKLGPPESGLYHNAACIYAQSVEMLERQADDSRADTLAMQYQDRAVTLIRESFEFVPREFRKRWFEKIWSDPALDPIRDAPQLRKLSQDYTNESS